MFGDLLIAWLAQLVERFICNEKVGGSNPSLGSNWNYGVVGLTCVPVTDETTGSNPVNSAKT